ncbi:MAG: matrixin family metalloprotease [Candidatus Obscuribacter sp.]|nr:matrixin family metalloprotease [Candidatus Obscuribacter sp.]MBK9281609.1 matrixin family metalloprotease [Candidatus Obscuribacter sp.]
MKQSKKQKSIIWQLTASLLAALLLSSLFLSDALAGSKANSHAREGFRLYQARQYAKALPSLRRASAENPRDLAVCYYLGTAAAFAGDNNLAINALSRLFVMCSAIDRYTVLAEPVFKRLRGSSRPYSCKLNNTSLIRWDPRSMPVNIYITDGKELPDGLSGQILSSDRITPYAASLHNSAYLNKLGTAAGYSSDMVSQVRSGLAQWQWLNSEKIVPHRIVDDPAKADVMVFFSGNMPNLFGFTIYPESRGVSYPLMSLPNVPVVIQLNTRGGSAAVMGRTACHEFGHAFGLQHSKSTSDIMFDGRAGMNVANTLSDSDILTIRALYQLPVDIWLVGNRRP